MWQLLAAISPADFTLQSEGGDGRCVVDFSMWSLSEVLFSVRRTCRGFGEPHTCLVPASIKRGLHMRAGNVALRASMEGVFLDEGFRELPAQG